MFGPMGESIYTSAVTTLVKYIQSDTVVKDSLFEQAQIYFETSGKEKDRRNQLKQDVLQLQKNLATSTEKEKSALQKKCDAAKQTYKKVLTQQQQARTLRYQKVVDVCSKLLVLSEGENWDDTQTNSAKLLGTLQLLSPAQGSKLALQHQKLKPAYKGVLALRLLDKLLLDKHISNQYIHERYHVEQRYSETENDITQFQRDVAIPVLIAAIFQDVGLLHPDAQLLIKGEDGKLDEFRVFNKDDRLTLLKINHQQTLDYIVYGIGAEQYVGNSKAEKVAFDENEKQRLNFTRSLIKEAIKPKKGIGNLLKVPQIYTSIIFSTKNSFKFSDLPKAGLVINKAAETEAVSPITAKTLLDIVGHFPQGYGITYIPKDEDNQDMDRYEYAIVCDLNPVDPYVPRCRVATRNLTFIPSGQSLLIKTDNNLYFPKARKKLERIAPERLEEILQKLVSNFEERKELDLIPSHWDPYGYFSYKKLQNLWKKL